MNSTNAELNVNSRESIHVVYSGNTLLDAIYPVLSNNFLVNVISEFEELDAYVSKQTLITLPDVILIEVEDVDRTLAFVDKLKRNTLLSQIIIIFLSPSINDKLSLLARSHHIGDYYTAPVPVNNLRDRILFLIKFRSIKPRILNPITQTGTLNRFPLKKRIFDLSICFLILFFIAPLFVIIALAIMIESNGPVIYRSKRVGARYKIFDFLKFRSMEHQSGIDILTLSKSNQYITDTGQTPTFNKIHNDPRVTRVGKFIRKYSLDELPQLFNVIRGDMSLVGNRPLPLYEAIHLTSDEWAVRFLAPAGLTGLWQISRRGKKDMSERERKKLDNFYAKNYSLRLDLKIILSTLPAMIQKEQV